MAKHLPALVALMALSGPVAAQTYPLAEAVVAGGCSRVSITLGVTGKLKVQLPGGKAGSESLEAAATHVFIERPDAADRAVRYYTRAGSTSVVSGTKLVRELGSDRRLIVVRPSPDGPLYFHPTLPLTRDDLDLVSEHFATHALPGLLPNKAVAVEESWRIPDETAKAVCQFDGLTANTFVGQLVAVRAGVAEFSVRGTAEGTELGATVKVAVRATGRYDLTAKRITAMSWEQDDVREQGPASPAAELKATVAIRREFLATDPDELSAAARANVPAAGPTESQLLLRHSDPAGKYALLYPRLWHVTGQTGDHLVLRLIERGDWIAQATIMAVKPTPDGKPMTAAEFKDAIAKQPGWEPAGIAADGELPAGPGRRLYRVTGLGKQDGLAVAQSFYHLVGPAGNQVVVTVVARDDRAAKLGSRDVALVRAITFPDGK